MTGHHYCKRVKNGSVEDLPTSALRATGFDPIQHFLLAQSFAQESASHLTSPGLSLYRLTPHNFEAIVAQMNEDHSATFAEHQLLVTSVPTLTLLGLHVESFPEETIFLTYEEFVDHFILGSAVSTISDLKALLGDRAEKFFHSHGLSHGQVSLLLLIALGHTNLEIAKRMTLTEKGVESAIKRLAIKLDCTREGSRPHNLRILLGRRYAQLLGVL